MQDRGIASAIFKFTDSIPGADIGPAYQTISLASGSLVSEVELTVFPGVSGYVVTSSRLSAASDTDMEVGGLGAGGLGRLPWLHDGGWC